MGNKEASPNGSAFIDVGCILIVVVSFILGNWETTKRWAGWEIECVYRKPEPLFCERADVEEPVIVEFKLFDSPLEPLHERMIGRDGFEFVVRKI